MRPFAGQLLVLLPVLVAGGTRATGAEPAAPRWELPPERLAAIKMFNAWKPPVPPRRLLGNIHYVGTSGIAVYLVTTPVGHVLIDTGFDDTVPHVLAGIEQLGLKPKDIKFILSSHAHIDHVGGLALMQRLTGASVVASQADAAIMASGGEDDFSPFPKDLMKYPPVHADRIVATGDRVTLGGLTLTAHLTPGHTKGATTWTMRVVDAGRSYDVVFLTSLSIVAGTRLLSNPAHPEIERDFATSFEVLDGLPCDVFFTFHTSKAALDALVGKVQQLQTNVGPNPFLAADTGWKAQLTNAERAFRDQLAAEKRAAGESSSMRSAPGTAVPIPAQR